MMMKIFNQIKPGVLCLIKRHLIVKFPQRRWEKFIKITIKGGEINIGKSCNFRANVQLRSKNGQIKIGEWCFFNSNVSITSLESIEIGRNVRIANNVVIVDHDHNYKQDLSTYLTDKITIGDNTWIGANAVILRGTRIGNASVVAAGTVVKGIFPDNSLIFQENGRCISKCITKG